MHICIYDIYYILLYFEFTNDNELPHFVPEIICNVYENHMDLKCKRRLPQMQLSSLIFWNIDRFGFCISFRLFSLLLLIRYSFSSMCNQMISIGSFLC